MAVELRFYEELNDFLPINKRRVAFQHPLVANQSVKDLIESVGVPHTEVDLILVNGLSVDFSKIIKNGDKISVYPMFEVFDISSVAHLRPKPLREPKFILDVHLGKLARYLRLLGFDTIYNNQYEDSVIRDLARAEHRIILTRDVELLKHKKVTHGYWVRETNPEKQAVEILRKFDLQKNIIPFSRCLVCNGKLMSVNKKMIIQDLQPKTIKYYQAFYQCHHCHKIYWEGSHLVKMNALIKRLVGSTYL